MYYFHVNESSKDRQATHNTAQRMAKCKRGSLSSLYSPGNFIFQAIKCFALCDSFDGAN